MTRLLLALLLSLTVSLSDSLDYSDIRKWNASCSPKDTCSVPRDLDDADHHNCDCSTLCALYDTCCIDSPFVNDASRKYRRTASCRSAGQSGEHAFMVDRCSASYKGSSAIRRRCEQDLDESERWLDPFTSLPVTQPKTQTTYKSLCCGLCNGEDPRDVVMWQIALDCSHLKGGMKDCVDNREFVLNNMMRVKGKWGIWSHDEEDSDWKFRYLDINYKVPDRIKKLVKHCRPNLISACPEDWKEDKIRKLCMSYTGAVYFPNATYRNIHCAICNRERDPSAMSCHETRTSAFKGATMNFGMLLDVDLRHGSKVGEVELRCGQDQVYDPFSRKCRDIECPIPGYKLVEGKCAPE